MPVEGAAREGADMVMECVEFGFEEVCNVFVARSCTVVV